jgi:hypothetical protein
MDRTDLVLIGASHLSNIGRHFYSDYCRVLDLTAPGWRINEDDVVAMMAEVTNSAAAVDWNTATVILQLFNNSVYMVSRPGGQEGPSQKRQAQLLSH